MPRNRGKRVVLSRTDHRIDIGPAGRNLFISRDKQRQSRQARRIKLGMNAVIVLGVLAVAVGFGFFVAFYLVPYFQVEMRIDTSSSSRLEGGGLQSQVEIPSYNSMGLPVYSDDVSLFVINQNEPQDASYTPNLVEAQGVQVEAHVVNALNRMVEAAKEDGLALVFTEGYVSYEAQQQRYEEKVTQLMEQEGLTTVMARTQARLEVPMAGECDLQTGLCVRVDANPDTFADSKTCSWLRTNMGKYGFVFRWPEGGEDYTGCEEDLTVLRYVGSENATAMQQRSMCLEEYISYLASQG